MTSATNESEGYLEVPGTGRAVVSAALTNRALRIPVVISRRNENAEGTTSEFRSGQFGQRDWALGEKT